MSFNINSSSFIPKKVSTTTTVATTATITTATTTTPSAPAATTTTAVATPKPTTNFTMNFTVFKPKASTTTTTTTNTTTTTTTNTATPKAEEPKTESKPENEPKPATVAVEQPKPAIDPEEEARKKEERKKAKAERAKAKKAEKKQQQQQQQQQKAAEAEEAEEEAEEPAELDDDEGFIEVRRGKKKKQAKQQQKAAEKAKKKEPAQPKQPKAEGEGKKDSISIVKPDAAKQQQQQKAEKEAKKETKREAAPKEAKKEAKKDTKKETAVKAPIVNTKSEDKKGEEKKGDEKKVEDKKGDEKKSDEKKGDEKKSEKKKKDDSATPATATTGAAAPPQERGGRKKKRLGDGEKGGSGSRGWRKGAGESMEDYTNCPVGNLGEELSEEIAKALAFMKTLREYSDIDPIDSSVTAKLDKMFQKKTQRKLREAKKAKRKMAKKKVKPLDVTENRWKRPTDVSERDKKLQTVRLTLNKMVPSNFEELSQKIAEVEIDSIDILSEVISLIFVKATLEPKWANMYARVCKLLHGAIKVPEGLETPEGKKVTFKGLILSNCQREFEENKGRVATVIPDDVSAEERELLENKKAKGHNMFIGNIIFIGELYNVRMLGSNVMFYCLSKLTENMKNPTEEDLEALVQLLKRVGKDLDAKTENAVRLDRYFAKIRAYTQLPNDVLALRVKVYLMNLIDLRQDRWVPRNPAADVALHRIVPTRVPSTPLHPFSPDLSSSSSSSSRSGVAQRSTSRHSRAPAAVAARKSHAEATAAANASAVSRSANDCKTIPSKSGLNIRRLRDPKAMLASSTTAAESFEDIIDNVTPSLTPMLSQSAADVPTAVPAVPAHVSGADDDEEEEDGPQLVAVMPHKAPAVAAAAAAAASHPAAATSPIRAAQEVVMLSTSPAPQSRLSKTEITEEMMESTRRVTGSIFEELVETKNVDEECLGFREEVNPSLMHVAITTMLEKCCLDTPRPVEAAELVGKVLYFLFTDEFITRRDVHKGLAEFLSMSLEDVLPDAPLLDEILAAVAKELIAGDTLTFSMFFDLVKGLAERSVPWKRNPGGLADALTLLTLKKLVADKGADKIAAKLADSDTCISDIFILAETQDQKLALTQTLLRDAGLLHAYPAVEAGTLLADLATYAADPAAFASAPESLVKDCVFAPMIIRAAVGEALKLNSAEAFLEALTKRWRPVLARVYEETSAKVNRFCLFSELAYAFGELGNPKGLFNAVISEYNLVGYVPEWANLVISVSNKSSVLNDIPKPSNRN